MNMLKYIHLTIFLAVAAAANAQPAANVTIYSDDFAGAQASLEIGKHDYMSLVRGGVSVVRSIKIPTGLQVVLYERDDFAGASLILTENASTHYLNSKGFGKISQNVSIIVEPAPEDSYSGPSVTIYRDNFSGASKNLQPGYFDHFELGAVENDQLSSVKVPKGMKVTLYEHGGNGGRTLVLTSDASASFLIQNKFNDLTSSIHVELIPEPATDPEPETTPEEETEFDEEVPDSRVDVEIRYNEDPAFPTVIVYQETNRTGKSKQLEPGRYDVGTLGVDDNEVSYVRVMEGVRIILYDQPGFKGKSLVLEEDADKNYLEGHGFNNLTSSVVVELLPRVTIFDGNYSGEAYSFGPGIYNNYNLPLANDAISSVKVVPGLWALLFEHSNFKGRSILLTQDATADFILGREFNNMTSSMVVGRTADPLPLVTLYKEDFEDPLRELTPGEYPLLESDNTVSSVTIPRGMKLTLYENVGFEGKSLTLFSKANAEEMKNFGFDNLASSARVEWIHPRDLVVTLYEGSFSGASQELSPGRYRVKDISLGDNTLSSLKIPNQMQVTLHEHDNFKGLSVTLDRDRDFTGSKMFDNLYSSIIVEDMREPLLEGLATVEVEETVEPVPADEESAPTEEVVENYTTGCTIDPEEYETAVSAIEGKAFSSDRMDMAKLVTKDRCLNNEQVRRIALLFGFEEQTLEFVKTMYPNATEKSTYYTLESVFKFSSSKEEFLKFLAQQR